MLKRIEGYTFQTGDVRFTVETRPSHKNDTQYIFVMKIAHMVGSALVERVFILADGGSVSTFSEEHALQRVREIAEIIQKRFDVTAGEVRLDDFLKLRDTLIKGDKIFVRLSPHFRFEQISDLQPDKQV